MSLLSTCSVKDCKRASTCLCLHCDKKVCAKHFNDHQKEVDNELLPLVDRVNQLKNTLKPEQDQNRPLNLLKQWRDQKYREIDEEYDRKVQELDREITKHESELSKIFKTMDELIQDGEASFEQIQQLQQYIQKKENQVNELMGNEQMDTTSKETDIELNLIDKYIQLGSEKAVIKGKVSCRNVSLYAMQSDKPLTAYDGLCPICRIAHIPLPLNRGFYARCEPIDELFKKILTKSDNN